MAYELVEIVGGASGSARVERIKLDDRGNANPCVFEATISEMGAAPFANFDFPPGTPVSITASGDPLLVGLVDVYNPSFDANSHAVQIHGTTDGREFSRSAVQHPTGRFEYQTILGIAQTLAGPYGIAVRAAGSAADRASEVIKQFQTRKGSTLWDEMMRLLPQRGMTIHGDRYGAIEIWAGAAGSHAGGLIQGKNILRASAQLSDQNLAAAYGVVGQSPLTYDKQATQIFATAPGGGKSGSYIEDVETADTDQGRAQQHAVWQAARAGGAAAQATIVTPSWRDEFSEFWTPLKQVFVYSPFLKIEAYLMIADVSFEQDPTGGTRATLTLQNSESYGGDTLGGNSWQGILTDGADEGRR